MRVRSRHWKQRELSQGCQEQRVLSPEAVRVNAERLGTVSEVRNMRNGESEVRNTGDSENAVREIGGAESKVRGTRSSESEVGGTDGSESEVRYAGGPQEGSQNCSRTAELRTFCLPVLQTHIPSQQWL